MSNSTRSLLSVFFQVLLRTSLMRWRLGWRGGECLFYRVGHLPATRSSEQRGPVGFRGLGHLRDFIGVKGRCVTEGRGKAPPTFLL